MFSVGEPVVCIDDSFCLLRLQCPPALVTPVRGTEYHVRAVVSTERGVGLLLEELDNAAVAPGYPEANFAIRRFARLAEMPVFADEMEEVTSLCEPA